MVCLISRYVYDDSKSCVKMISFFLQLNLDFQGSSITFKELVAEQHTLSDITINAGRNGSITVKASLKFKTTAAFVFLYLLFKWVAFYKKLSFSCIL